jgi:hypothetical protein
MNRLVIAVAVGTVVVCLVKYAQRTLRENHRQATPVPGLPRDGRTLTEHERDTLKQLEASLHAEPAEQQEGRWWPWQS